MPIIFTDYSPTRLAFDNMFEEYPSNPQSLFAYFGMT